MNVPKIIFIVPYRNREKEKIHFSIYMKYILEDYDSSSYEIYYSHQNDKRPFNRGATKNIGFLVMKNKYPENYKDITFVFNDIDTIPAEKNTLNYETSDGIVKHFYGFNFALGGIFSIKGKDFEKCSGFPNNWGWGIEDNEINDKVLKNNLKIDRTNFFPFNSKEIIHLYDSPNRLINNSEPKNYKDGNLFDNLNTIKNIKFTIENNVENINNQISNQYIINIDDFVTAIDYKNQIFYNQNMLKNRKLRINSYETMQHKKQWQMKMKF
jgi:hypothetical protein